MREVGPRRRALAAGAFGAVFTVYYGLLIGSAMNQPRASWVQPVMGSWQYELWQDATCLLIPTGLYLSVFAAVLVLRVGSRLSSPVVDIAIVFGAAFAGAVPGFWVMYRADADSYPALVKGILISAAVCAVLALGLLTLFRGARQDTA